MVSKRRPYQFWIWDLLEWTTAIAIGLSFLHISDRWAGIFFVGAGLLVVVTGTVRFVAIGPDTMFLRTLRGILASSSVAAICFFWIPLSQAIGQSDAWRLIDLPLIMAAAGLFGGVMGIVLPLLTEPLRSM
jgi:hypothetical protein